MIIPIIPRSVFLDQADPMESVFP